MKTPILAGLTLALALSLSTAHASTEGHGAGMLICPTLTPKAQLFDLWKASYIPPVEKTDRSGSASMEERVEQALVKLAQYDAPFAALVRAQYNRTREPGRVQPLKEDVLLKFPRDSLMDHTCKDAEEHGLARWYDDTDLIDLDTRLYVLLDPIDQAALWIHESVYKVLRMRENVGDSLRAQRITGLLFSSKPAASFPKKLLPSNLLSAPGYASSISASISTIISVGWEAVEGQPPACAYGRIAYMPLFYVGTDLVPTHDPVYFKAGEYPLVTFPQTYENRRIRFLLDSTFASPGCRYVVVVRDQLDRVVIRSEAQAAGCRKKKAKEPCVEALGDLQFWVTLK
jgi:hypothetical protein